MLFCLALLLPAGVKAEAADISSLTLQFVGDECIIAGCDPLAEGVIDIPSQISGKTVTVIAENAFSKCKKLTEINLPDTVNEIGNGAFYTCSMLRSMTIPDSVKIIGQGIFSQCINLEEVILPESLGYISEDMFYKCSSLKAISIPAETRIIGENAFFGCSGLTGVVLPEGLVSVSARCFSNCTSLSTVCIASTVKNIDADVFEGCTSLNCIYYTDTEDAYEQINISTGNDYLLFENIKFNHDHSAESLITIYEAACNQDGYSVYTCPCGYVSKGDYVSATGHSLKFISTQKEPTCTETGFDVYECITCGYSESCELPAKDHTPVTDKKIKATCTSKGKTEGSHCARCGKTIVSQRATSALGHDYTLRVKDRKHLASEATYKNAAKYYYSCSRCKKIGSKTFSGDKLTLPKVKKLDFTAGERSVTLKWKKISAARGYAVYKKDSKGKWSLVKRVTTNSFKISKLNYATVYTYAVRAYVKEGKTLVYAPEYTSIKVATRPLTTSKITAKQNEKAITLSWKKSKGATGYRVYRYDSNRKKWVVVCSCTKSNKLTVKNLDSGRKYKFAVKSCVDTGNKLVWSEGSRTIVTCTRPAKTKVKATPLKYSVKLEWSKVKYADRYVIYMSKNVNSGYKKIASTKGTNAEIKKLSAGKTYYFKVYSYRKLADKNVYSYASEIKKVKTR